MTNKTALVTGSTRGIGYSVASRLIAEGWIVGINGRSAPQVNQAVSKLGPSAVPVVFDISNRESVNLAMREFAKTSGALDAVVNCAGVMMDSPITTVSEELLNEVFNINVFGAFFVLQTAVKIMAKQRSGSIVLFSSIAGEDGSRGQSVYSASKGAISALVKSTAKELAPLGIRINGIAPGPIDTDLFQFFDEATRENIQSQIPLRKLGLPEDISPLVKLLVSEDSSFITGEIFRVDGGL